MRPGAHPDPLWQGREGADERGGLIYRVKWNEASLPRTIQGDVGHRPMGRRGKEHSHRHIQPNENGK